MTPTRFHPLLRVAAASVYLSACSVGTESAPPSAVAPQAAVQPVVRPAQPAPSAPKEFGFVVQGGQNVIATTRADVPENQRRMVVFSPFLERTDGNLYQASLQCLWNLYGKERGLFQLQDAKTQPEPDLGGNAICWTISNPTAEYCVFPTKDEASGRIGALTVWVR